MAVLGSPAGRPVTRGSGISRDRSRYCLPGQLLNSNIKKRSTPPYFSYHSRHVVSGPGLMQNDRIDRLAPAGRLALQIPYT